MIEIERKFLVKSDDYKKDSHQQNKIFQGYLNSNPARTVRVRIRDKEGYLTVKGKSSSSGLSRYEWEKQIDFDEAMELLRLCEPAIIEKTRYLVNVGNSVFEIDEFFGANEGLVIAEIELDSENSDFAKPAWLGEEVTGDTKYYNSLLSKTPFTEWESNKGGTLN